MTPKETHDWLRGTAYITHKDGVAPFPLGTAIELVRLAQIGLKVEDEQLKRANRSVTEATSESGSIFDGELGPAGWEPGPGRVIPIRVDNTGVKRVVGPTHIGLDGERTYEEKMQTEADALKEIATEQAPVDDTHLRQIALSHANGNLDTAVAMLAFLKGEEQKDVEEDQRIEAWHIITKHIAFQSCFDDESQPLIDAMMKKLDIMWAACTA